jgi:hypothetical protein
MHNQWLLLFFNNLLNNEFFNIDIDNLWSLPQPPQITKFNPTWWLLKKAITGQELAGFNSLKIRQWEIRIWVFFPQLALLRINEPSTDSATTYI